MLTVAAVAEKLDVSPKHVYRLIHNGELKALLVGKRALKRLTYKDQVGEV